MDVCLPNPSSRAPQAARPDSAVKIVHNVSMAESRLPTGVIDDLHARARAAFFARAVHDSNWATNVRAALA
jgi:hypothetical protein